MPILVATNLSNEEAQRYSFQAKNLRMTGLNWIFYSDGTNFGYKTSYDNYSAFTALWTITYGNHVSLWFDGLKVYYIRRVSTSAFAYRRGMPNSNATITWDFDEVVVYPSIINPGGSIVNCAVQPFIASDNNGNIWMVIDWVEDVNGTLYNYTRIYYAPASTPTTPSERDDLRMSASYMGGIIPLTGNKLAFIYGSTSYFIFARFSDNGGATWTSPIVTSGYPYNLGNGSFTSYGDTVYVSTQNTSTQDFHFLKIAYGDSEWTEILVDTTPAYESYAGINVERLTGKIRVFWTEYNSTIMYVYISEDGGSTWTKQTFLTNRTTYVRWINTTRSDLDNIILVSWKERTITPYYLYLEVVSTAYYLPVMRFHQFGTTTIYLSG